MSLVNRTRCLATALSVVLLARASASAQGRLPWGSAEHIAAIPREELDAITARGRLLAEYDQSPPNGATRVEATYHTHVLSDRPEDTDVFHVLSRTPSVADYIASQSHYFRIDPDGRITAFDRDPASKGP